MIIKCNSNQEFGRVLPLYAMRSDLRGHLPYVQQARIRLNFSYPLISTATYPAGQIVLPARNGHDNPLETEGFKPPELAIERLVIALAHHSQP